MSRSALLALLALLAPACGRAEQGAPATGTAAAEEQAAADPASLLPNGILLEGDLLVGGQPSLEQMAALSEMGYGTVISLRGPDEPAPSAEEIRALGLEPVSLPITSADDLDEPHARRLAELLEASEGPVVLHCGSGNRVGALLALKARWVDGASPEEALEIGLESGLTRLEGTVREKLGVEE